MSQVLAAPASFGNTRAKASTRAPYFLFILMTATLFLRPAEIVPQLMGLPIYEILILNCMVLSFPLIVEQLRIKSLIGRPITICVISLLFAVIASHFSHFQFVLGLTYGFEFFKVVIYFLLMVAVVNSTARIKQFLYSVMFFTLIVTLLALLNYQPFSEQVGIEQWHTPSFVTDVEMQDEINPETGKPIMLQRLAAAGLFGNANDFARLMVLAVFLALLCVTDKKVPIPRVFLWLIILIFLYALKCTYSRGGFTALLAGIGILGFCRLNFRQSIIAAVIVLPVILVAFGGRQLNISASQGTGKARIELWREGFLLMKGSPVFGIGMGEYSEQVKLVAHNSFVHCFTELGFFGGTLFVGAFYLALLGTYQSNRSPGFVRQMELSRIRPFVLAILASSAMGMLTSTRCYSAPTYMILGLATAYFCVVAKTTGWNRPRLDASTIKQVVIVSMITLVMLYVYVRLVAP